MSLSTFGTDFILKYMDYEKFPLFIFFVRFYVRLEFLLLQVFGKSSLSDSLELTMWGEGSDNYWSQVLFEDNKTFYIYIFLGLFLFIVYIWVLNLLLFLFFFFSLVFQDMVTLYKPGCPRIYCAAQVSSKFTIPIPHLIP